MKIIIVGSIILVGLATVAITQSRAAYESAEYNLVEKDGDFEIRDYEPIVLVTTPMESAGSNSAFSRLFGYISGSNEDSQKISMTTPVFSTRNSDSYKMSFVMPKKVANAGAPLPDNNKIEIEEMAGGRFATYRFSGSADQQLYDQAASKLRAWTEERGLETSGDLIFAGYDPPFTPNFLRRNEVLVRLAEEKFDQSPRGVIR